MDEKTKKEIGKRIRRFRETKELKQNQLAEMLGISHSTLSRIESGGVKPTVEILFKIQSLLDVSIDWIFTGEGAPMRMPSIESSEDLRELVKEMRKNKVTKHAVLKFFYQYKSERNRKEMGKS